MRGNEERMDKTTLPGTDLLVSLVCLGTMQLAGSVEEGTVDITWGAVSQETATATVVAALVSDHLNLQEHSFERSLSIAGCGHKFL